MTAGLSMSRALVDGISDLNVAEAGLVVKGLMEEINYARRQVTRWIYSEYRQIAEAAGFDRFPKIRWDEGILQDVILYMNTISQLVDRRMLSYRTAHEALGFDYPTELMNMQEEFPIVQKGELGIIGSPWQQSAAGSGVQPKQKAPVGTPSSGRPKGQPAKKRTPETKPKPKKAKPKTVADIAKEMSDEDYALFKHQLDLARLEQ